MSQSPSLPPPGFESLSREEQIDYVQCLWDHIAGQPEKVPVPDWHRKVLAERLGEYDSNQIEGKTWEQFQEELDGNIESVE